MENVWFYGSLVFVLLIYIYIIMWRLFEDFLFNTEILLFPFGLKYLPVNEREIKLSVCVSLLCVFIVVWVELRPPPLIWHRLPVLWILWFKPNLKKHQYWYAVSESKQMKILCKCFGTTLLRDKWNLWPLSNNDEAVVSSVVLVSVQLSNISISVSVKQLKTLKHEYVGTFSGLPPSPNRNHRPQHALGLCGGMRSGIHSNHPEHTY